jgi:hypothetical protein
MTDDTTKMTENEFEKFIQKESSRFLKLETEIMETYGKEQLTLFYKILDFTYQILAVVGLVAGFGFTALGSVQYIFAFIAGEAFLLSAIIYGLYRIQKVYSDNLDSLDANKDEIKEAFANRRNALRVIVESHQTKGEVNKKDGERLIEKNNAILKPFLPKETEKEKEEQSPLKVIMVLFILGSILLLAAFLPSIPKHKGLQKNTYMHHYR